MLSDLPPFPGFRPEAFAFLRALEKHNERDWFKPRKATFDDELWWPMQCLVADAGREARVQGLPLAGDPKRGLFRIYRDTRFSKNKSPYKTHLGAVLSRSGGRKDPGGLYIHVEPGNSFAAAGFWAPDGPAVRRWRDRIASNPAAFLAMRDALAEHDLELSTRDSYALKRLPRGYEALADHEVAPYLRWKAFVASRSFPDEALQAPTFTSDVIEFARDVLPLLKYGWALGEGRKATGEERR